MPAEPILTEFVATNVSKFTRGQIDLALEKYPQRFLRKDSQFMRVAIDRLLEECGFSTSEPLIERQNE